MVHFMIIHIIISTCYSIRRKIWEGFVHIYIKNTLNLRNNVFNSFDNKTYLAAAKSQQTTAQQENKF